MEAGHSHPQSPGSLRRQDSWTCPRCGWVYPNPHPSAKHRRNHKRNCGKIKGFELSSASHNGGSSDDASSDEESHSKEETGHETPGSYAIPKEESHVSLLKDNGGSSAEHSEIKTNVPDKDDPTLVYQPYTSISESDSSCRSISVLPIEEASPILSENNDTKMLALQDNAESGLKSAEISTASITVPTGEELKGKGVLASSIEDTGKTAGYFQPDESSVSEMSKCIELSSDEAVKVDDSKEVHPPIESSADIDTSAGRLERGRGKTGGDFQPEISSEPEISKCIEPSRDGAIEVEDSQKAPQLIESSSEDLKTLAGRLERVEYKDDFPVLSPEEKNGDNEMLAEQDNAESALKSEDRTTANAAVESKEKDGLVSFAKDTGKTAGDFQADTSSESEISKCIESLRDEALQVEDDKETHPVFEGDGGNLGISVEGLEKGEGDLSSLHVAERDISTYEESRNISTSQTPTSENVDEKDVSMKEDPSSNSISSGSECKDLMQDGEGGTRVLMKKAAELPLGSSSEQALILGETVAIGPECLPDREREIRPNERNPETASETVAIGPECLPNREREIRPNERNPETSIPGQPDYLVSNSNKQAALGKDRMVEGSFIGIEGTQTPCQLPAVVKDMNGTKEGNIPSDSRDDIINLKLEKPDNEVLERPSESGDVLQGVVSAAELPKNENDLKEGLQLDSSSNSSLSYAPLRESVNAEVGINKEEVRCETVSSDLQDAGLEKDNDTEAGSVSSPVMRNVVRPSIEEDVKSGETMASSLNSPPCVEMENSLKNIYSASQGSPDCPSSDLSCKAVSEGDGVHVVSPVVIDGESDPCQLHTHFDDKDKSIEKSAPPDLRADAIEQGSEKPNTEISESTHQEKVVTVAELMNRDETVNENLKKDSTTEIAAPRDIGDFVKESDDRKYLQAQESFEVPNEKDPAVISSNREPETVLDTGFMPMGGVKVVFSERSDSLGTETYEDAPDSFETGSVGGSFDENEMPDDSRQPTDGRLEGQSIHRSASSGEKVSELSIEMEKPKGLNNSSSLEAVPEKKQDIMSKENLVGTSKTQDLKAPSPEAWQEPGTWEVGIEDNEAQAEQSVQPVSRSSHTEVREHQISEKEHTPLRSLLAKEGSEKLDQNPKDSSEKGDEKKKMEDTWGSHNDQKPKTRSIWSHCICCPAVH